MPNNTEISELKLVLRQSPDGALGVQIYDRSDRNSPLRLLAAGMIAELQTQPNRILARGEAAFDMWKNLPKEG